MFGVIKNQFNLNDDYSNFEFIFFKVWKNIYLVNEIFKHVKLFKKYQTIEFFNRQSLLEFEFLEYVSIIKYLGNDTNQLKKSDLPQSGVLKSIEFKETPISKGIGTILPDGLLEVILPEYNKTPTLPSTFPSSVTFIDGFYPENGKYESLLELNKDVEWEIIFSNEFKPSERIYKGAIPNSITKLSFGCDEWNNFNFKLREGDLIGTNLISLDLGAYEFDSIEPKTIPNTIKELRINSPYPTYIKPFQIDILPIGLISLYLTGNFNQPFLKNALPNTLKFLKIGYWYNQSFEPGVLPDSLEVLIFFSYGKYEKEIKENVLPQSLTDLQLPRSYPLFNDFSKVLPFSIKNLLLPKNFQSIIDSFDKSISIKFFK